VTTPDLLERVEEFLALRRRLGFAPESVQYQLRSFARYAEGVGHEGPITTALAAAWAALPCSDNPAQAERRLGTVRTFARHCLAFEPDTEVPPCGFFGRITRRPPPHIYSDAEITALITACHALSPQGGLRPRTYVAFFGLLAACGLRLSEARGLARRDVDLRTGVLTIREGKCRKSRFVPLHPTTREALCRYAAARDRVRYKTPSESFFRTEQAPALRFAAVQKTFSRLRTSLGWDDTGRAHRPRIHDLRHTMAVRSLQRAYDQDRDIDRHVHALSVYLGHARVTDTYWYLTAVPELMDLGARRFEAFASREQECDS
jgi:integrase